MSQLARSAVVAIWPSLPGMVRKYYWPTRILNLLGLAAPYQKPNDEPEMPSELAEVARSYRSRGITYFTTGTLTELQDRNVARTMVPFLNAIHQKGRVNHANASAFISEFRRAFLASPILSNDGGANYTSGMILFLIAKHLDPELIVESGVLRGMSSYIFRAATSRARIAAFDLNFSILSRTNGVEYYEHDWTRSDLISQKSSLIYFDDHVNQAQRILEAHRRGFRHLIFDDSWSWGAITGCGGVPLPTIDMLMTGDGIKVGETVQWFEADKLQTYTHNEEREKLWQSAKRLIKAEYDIPTLYREVGIAPTSALKFVELV